MTPLLLAVVLASLSPAAGSFSRPCVADDVLGKCSERSPSLSAAREGKPPAQDRGQRLSPGPEWASKRPGVTELRAAISTLKPCIRPFSASEPAQAVEDLFYCHNSLGSVTAVTDSAGNVVERYGYKAYGATTVLDANRVAKLDQTPIQPYGFTGRRMDYEEGSKLYYYRNRYYDPEAGRFISRDPLGMWGDAGQRGNGQNYCGNNPINRIDPLGLTNDLWWAQQEASIGWLLNNSEGLTPDQIRTLGIQYDVIAQVRDSFGRPSGTVRYEGTGFEAGGLAGDSGSAGDVDAAYWGGFHDRLWSTESLATVGGVAVAVVVAVALAPVVGTSRLLKSRHCGTDRAPVC